ncbi:polyprenyl synthetase family protein [Streptomyces sp. NPDC000594]|uniref:polyprenyl synthetase family protein n=1 Tax=Streptomyces sp. NPDC000594 TaxID=3154261 RepID=UPI003324D906
MSRAMAGARVPGPPGAGAAPPAGSAPEGSGVLGELAVLKERVDAVLRVFAEGESALLEAVDPELKPVGEQLRGAVAEGKRLRAAFCYWGWRAAGRDDGEDIVRAAAAMELVHAAAVVHDDLIDRSPVRHGRPTAHRALAPGPAGGSGAAGASAGRSLALLVGDLLISWSGQLFADCGLPAAYLRRAGPLWATLARELVAGECLEVLRTRPPGDGRADPESSFQIIRYKTAKYTVEHPLQIGVLLGGGPVALRETFTAYGVPLGEAFQLRDDLLGTFGTPETTGKSNLDDLAGAKPTVLLALARQRATAAERSELRRLLTSPAAGPEAGAGADAGPGRLDRFREIAERTGARRRVEELIALRAEAAADALDRALLAGVLPSHAAETLHALAGRSLARAA